MNKLWLIIKREYISRVTKRAFILGTILTPVGIGLLIFVNVKLAMYKDDNAKNIAILDLSGILKTAPSNQQNVHFTLVNGNLADLKTQVSGKKYDGILVMPPVVEATNRKFTIKYYSDDKLYLAFDLPLTHRLTAHLDGSARFRRYEGLVDPTLVGYVGYTGTFRDDWIYDAHAELHVQALSWLRCGVSYSLLVDSTNFAFINGAGERVSVGYLKHAAFARIDIAY